MVLLDVTVINGLLNDPAHPAAHPTGEELRKFYHKLTAELHLRSSGALKYENSDDADERQIYFDAELITESLVMSVIGPLLNLYPALCALNRGIHNHTLDTPLDERYLKQYKGYGEEYDFSALKEEIPRDLVSEIRRILIDIKPKCELITHHYSTHPPEMGQARERTLELLNEHQDDLRKLVDYSRGLSSAANIRPAMFLPQVQ